MSADAALTREALAAALWPVGEGPARAVNRPSDYDLNPSLRPPEGVRVKLREAAVLAALVERGDGFHVILTERAKHLPSHGGQIAFPGGKVEAGETSLQAALREAREEIGLAPETVEVLGELDPYETGTGFHIRPFVGVVAGEPRLSPDPSEVDEIFETPLAFLMNPANHRRDAREWRGALRQFYAMPWETRYIWGATAGMLRNLYERLRAP